LALTPEKLDLAHRLIAEGKGKANTARRFSSRTAAHIAAEV
jgi:hypothetical protein